MWGLRALHLGHFNSLAIAVWLIVSMLLLRAIDRK